jgi:hypothetical protein
MNAKEVEQKRGELLAELWKVGHTLGMPTSEGQRARNDRIEEIQRQLNELPQPEAQATGEEAGIIQIGAFLGDPWSPPPKEPDARELARGDDPFYRFAVESGWENK